MPHPRRSASEAVKPGDLGSPDPATPTSTPNPLHPATQTHREQPGRITRRGPGASTAKPCGVPRPGSRCAHSAAAARSQPAAASPRLPQHRAAAARPAETGGRWRGLGAAWARRDPRDLAREQGRAQCRPQAGRASRCAALRARVQMPVACAERPGAAGKLLLLRGWRQMGGGLGRPQVRRGRCNAVREAVGLRFTGWGGAGARPSPYLLGWATPAARPRRAFRTGKSPRREGRGKRWVASGQGQRLKLHSQEDTPILPRFVWETAQENERGSPCNPSPSPLPRGWQAAEVNTFAGL